MKKQNQSQLKAQYRERKQEMGIFQISFANAIDKWIGGAPDISTIQNRISFTLKQGNDNNIELQYLYQQQGEAQMHFEILEKMDFEPDAYLRRGILKSKIAQWAQTNNATPMRI